MTPIAFERTFAAPYETLERVSPRIRRMLANNPSAFTFKGTGVYVVGDKNVAVIDPGPADASHFEALKRAFTGLTVSHILITHTHADHSPAARALKEWTGAKTYGYGPHAAGAGEGAITEEGADLAFVPDVTVRDGEVLRADGFTIECVYTPGHIGNHMCYALAEEKALFTGDHVMGWATSVVIPPDGDMAAYMASLEKLLARDDEIYWPTHGAPIRDPKAYVRALIAHRREREAQIVDFFAAHGEARIPDIVRAVYAGLDPLLAGAAAMSVLAHLIKLRREGVVASDGETLSSRFRLKKS
jgi:glyoxylase-like metal-dependent hydrolase (beta-lactamase superfamily II)